MLVDATTIMILGAEVFLLVWAAYVYVAATAGSNRTLWAVLSLVAYAGAAGVILFTEGRYWGAADDVTQWSITGPIVVDYLGYTMRLLALLVGVLLTLVTWQATSRRLSGEYLATLTLLIVGLMLVARANDLVLVFVSLELVSIPTYVLIYLGRRDRATSEAAVKYFFLSVLASAVLLYGLSFLYGVSGTTAILGPAGQPSIRAAAAGGEAAGALAGLTPLALVLIVAGLGFKMAAVPFHFYAPDVFQGANNATAGLLAVAPKVAGVVVLMRLLIAALPGAADLGWQLTLVLAVLTMTLGNVCALWQQNVRRLMAYSSIAHAGYMLIGLSVGFAGAGGSSGYGGVGAALFYLFVYVLGSLGMFAALVALSSDRRELNGVDELAGLGRTRPAVAAAIAVCMFSLAGIPPLAGFWGKLGLFSSAVRTALGGGDASLSLWFTVLAVAGAINAAIAAAYYLRIVATMYFRPATVQRVPTERLGAATAMFACAVLLVAIGAFPRAAVDASLRSDSTLQLVTDGGTGAESGMAGTDDLPRARAAGRSRWPSSGPR